MLGEQRLVGEDVGARAVRDDAPAGQDHGPLAQAGSERQVVGDDQQRAVDRVEDLQQLAPRATACPSDFRHFRIVPASMESERRGSATSAMHRRVYGARRRPLACLRPAGAARPRPRTV